MDLRETNSSTGKCAPRCCLVAAAVLVTACAGADTIEELLANASAGGCYRRPAAEELDHAQSLFDALFAMTQTPSATLAVPEELQMQCARLHLHLVQVAQQGWLLLEDDAYKRGRGAYWFRAASPDSDAAARPWLLQAPHGPSDLDTRQIAARLVNEGPFAAAGWNTVRRDAAIEGESEKADLAHLDDTYFNCFTRAFARRFPAGYVIQIHGFGDDEDALPDAGEPDLILSSGSEHAAAFLTGLDACLSSRLTALMVNGAKADVRVYPAEVHELGGTTNAQAKLLRAMGSDKFLHVEMSRKARELLRHDRDSRRQVIECFSEHLK